MSPNRSLGAWIIGAFLFGIIGVVILFTLINRKSISPTPAKTSPQPQSGFTSPNQAVESENPPLSDESSTQPPLPAPKKSATVKFIPEILTLSPNQSQSMTLYLDTGLNKVPRLRIVFSFDPQFISIENMKETGLFPAYFKKEIRQNQVEIAAEFPQIVSEDPNLVFPLGFLGGGNVISFTVTGKTAGETKLHIDTSQSEAVLQNINVIQTAQDATIIVR